MNAPDVEVRSTSIGLNGPAILIHGGAWDIPDDALEDHRDGLSEAMQTGEASLASGASALDVAVDVVASLEAHGAFDAGTGAMLNQDGRAQLDAGAMDGLTRAYGSVMATERLVHPIRVARRLMDAGRGQVRMLTGEGAERFAKAEGFRLVDNDVLVCKRERERYARRQAEASEFHPSHSFLPGAPTTPGGHDTVGCVVRDADGGFAAATSTGGTPFKPPGRIGDSPLPGAGFYATEGAAVSSTGWGEAIAAVVLAHAVTTRVDAGAAPEDAARTELSDMHARIRNPEGDGACAGLIILSDAAAVWAYTTPRMARALWTPRRQQIWVDDPG